MREVIFMMMKFFGEPLKEIKSKTSGKMMFRFDTKGEFVTDDEEIIKRAMGFFDHMPYKAEPDGERVAKTVVVPVMTITTKENDAKEEVKEEVKPEIKLKHCSKCDFTCENQGELLKHHKENHPKEG
jgi:DNA-binding cell septation regulator SpoVG